MKKEYLAFWKKVMGSINTEAFRECPECGHTLNEPNKKIKKLLDCLWMKNQGCDPPLFLHCHNCHNCYAVCISDDLEDKNHPELSKLGIVRE